MKLVYHTASKFTIGKGCHGGPDCSGTQAGFSSVWLIQDPQLHQMVISIAQTVVFYGQKLYVRLPCCRFQFFLHYNALIYLYTPLHLFHWLWCLIFVSCINRCLHLMELQKSLIRLYLQYKQTGPLVQLRNLPLTLLRNNKGNI